MSQLPPTLTATLDSAIAELTKIRAGLTEPSDPITVIYEAVSELGVLSAIGRDNVTNNIMNKLDAAGFTIVNKNQP